MAKIIIENLEFYAFHGVYSREHELGTKFRVCAVIELTDEIAFESDTLDDALNYELVIADILRIGRDERFRLIERLCDAISERIMDYTKVSSLSLTLSKWLELEGMSGIWVSVQVNRSKSSKKLENSDVIS